MSPTEEIYGKVAKVLVDALNVDEDDLAPTATLQGDLGAESIDFLDIVFRLEREFGIKIPRGELFPESVFQGDPDFVREGRVTDQGMGALRSRMPYADLEAFDQDRRLDAVSDLFTVGLITRYVAWKLGQARPLTDAPPAFIRNRSRSGSGCPIPPLPPEPLELSPLGTLRKTGTLSGPGSRLSRVICAAVCSEGGECRHPTPGDLTLATNTTTSGRLQVGLKRLGFLLLSCTLGCSQGRYSCQEDLAQRILPATNLDMPEVLPAPKETVQEASGASQVRPGQPKSSNPVDSESARLQGLAQAGGAGCERAQTLTLPEAIETAFREQPRLRASLESIQQAQGREDIAFAAFLPTVTGSYLAGGYHIQAGGTGFPIPGIPNSPTFTVLPLLGSVPVGIQGQTGFEVAELKLQWLVCDFGRRLGRYNQAGLAVDIAQLQTQRVYQTVANDVAAAYYQVLRARSLHRIATESVRRAEDDLDVARKLAKRGVIEREKVLRAEAALAQAQRALDIAEEGEAVAVAALNLAIGLNVSAPTGVVDTGDVPPFTLGLTECLLTAVAARREFQVARQSVQVAQEGSRVARADFAPRIVAEGNLLDFQQSSPRGHFDLPFAAIKLEWGLFEGGKRVAEVRVADSRTREAVAQAESIADTIAFQVNQAYHQLVAARKGIDRSRPAVDQWRETYRLVVARSRQGDATPAELTEAEAGLTRAEQDYANSVYDYLTALERIRYAMGTTETPLTPGSH